MASSASSATAMRDTSQLTRHARSILHCSDHPFSSDEPNGPASGVHSTQWSVLLRRQHLLTDNGPAYRSRLFNKTSRCSHDDAASRPDHGECEQLKLARLAAEWSALAQDAARSEASFDSNSPAHGDFNGAVIALHAPVRHALG